MAKIGRNEPCPCGSGKKYKHCCYGTVQEAFDGLQSLALYESQEEILEDETRDGNEILLEVSFDWLRKGNKKHKAGTTLFLGGSRSRATL